MYENSNNILSNKEAYIEGYTEIIKFLYSKGKKVIFAIDNPELNIDPTTCLQRSINTFSKKISDCSFSKNLYNKRNEEYYEAIDKIKEQFPDLLIYDPTSAFCDDDKCYGKFGNNIVYEDNNHLNVIGAKILGQDFKKWFNNLDKK